MNGAFRFEPLPHFSDRLENIISWWHRCHHLRAAGLLVTAWEPYRLAIELTTVLDAAAASLWLDNDAPEPRRMLERGFARVFGGDGAKAAAKVALACDRHPFGGYPRWEINTRWDTVSRREPLQSYRAEEKWFRSLSNQTRRRPGIPESLHASVEFRWYLAARDLWVREAQQDSARGILQRQRSTPAGWRRGLGAARRMWNRTRSRNACGPNEAMLLADIHRLKSWRGGEPVLGSPWQLCYQVDNFAPATQLVGVEQQRADGKWETRQACHTIEFQARVAHRRGGLIREHAAPVDWNGDSGRPPRLRFFVRGVGQVRIKVAELTNGITVWPTSVKNEVLGRPAPRRGLPRMTTSYLPVLAAVRRESQRSVRAIVNAIGRR